MIQKAKKTRKQYGWNVEWMLASAGDKEVREELVGTVFVTFVDLEDCGTRDNAVLIAALDCIHPIITRLDVHASCVSIVNVCKLYSVE